MGDVDGDGVLDMFIGNAVPDGGIESESLNWECSNRLLLGRGDGSFTDATLASLPSAGRSTNATWAAAMGDIDGDGDLDLVLGNYGKPNEKLVNDGTGKFSAFACGESINTTAVALGDVNGDGLLDVFFGTVSGEENELLMNHRSGDFILNGTSPGGDAGTYAVAMGDVDGDGHLDLLLGTALPSPNALLLNDGEGGFRAVAGVPFGSADTLAVAMGDVDGDGHLDLLLGNASGPDELLMGDGLGSFRVATGLPSRSVATHSVALGDVDSDGDLDLFIGTGHGAGSELLLNDGRAGFSASVGFPGGILQANAVAMGDLDSDGDLDLVIGTQGDGDEGASNALLLGARSDGAFGLSDGFLGGSANTLAVAMGDVDADGALDLLIGNGGSDPNELLMGDGAGGFSTTDGFPGGAADTRAVAMGDVDGDLDLDLVIGNSDVPTQVLLNDGRGDFHEVAGLPDGHTTKVRAVALGDVDADGDLDLVVGNADNQANELWLNNGSGFFTAASDFPGRSASTYAVALGDLDSDGDLDIVFGNDDRTVNDVLLNDGSGKFSLHILAFMGAEGVHSSTVTVALGDVDGDGDLDLVVGNYAGPTMLLVTMEQSRLFLNDGTGTFVHTDAGGAPGTFLLPGTLHRVFDVAMGDVDGDGDLDLIFANADAERPNELLLNNGSGVFSVSTDFQAASPSSVSSYAVALGDVDSDGDLDVVFGVAGGPNELLAYVHCPDGGAPLRGSSACFACLPSMGLSPSGVCSECRPDEVSQGKFGAESCSIPCVLGERPIGADRCTECKSIVGTFHNGSIVRELTDPSTWAAPRCEACPAGTYAEESGATCIGCLPGQFAADAGSAECGPCGPGTFSQEAGSTRCDACQLGGYCESEGQDSALMAWRACPAGTMGNATRLKNESQCIPCARGHFCLEGRRGQQPVQMACPAGRFGAEERLPDSQCSGPCPPGHYCEAGSISNDTTPCPAGKFLRTEGGTRAEDCQACPPGSIAPNASTAVCDRCAAGTFQPAEQATACRLCTNASWCAEGSSAPTLCSTATYGNGLGLQSPEQCLPCERGYWCSAGEAFPCGASTYNNRTGASNLNGCIACPDNSFSAVSSTSVAACQCDKGFYDADTAADSVDCQACPLGSVCEGDGATLTSLPLKQGYFRASTTSADPRRCPTYGGVLGEDRCVGNETGAACRGNLTGVYCTKCPVDTYLSTGGVCQSCDRLTASAAATCAAVGVAILLLVLLVLSSRRISHLTGRHSLWRRAATLVEASGLAAKAKQLISFYQMVTSIQSAFLVAFPKEVRDVLSAFELLSLNLFELGLPLECMGLGKFLYRLVFMLVAPLLLVACTPLLAAWLLREDGGVDCGGGALLLRALPIALKLLYFVFPLVSAVAVQAFDCEGFDNGEDWLRADFSLFCGSEHSRGGPWEPSDEYERVRMVAGLGLLLYPIGVPLLFLMLLLTCRKQLSRRAPSTPLSTSLGFLCAEYRKRFFVWEVFESAKKLFFISFIRLLQPGTLLQLLLALVAALSCLIYQLTAAPFKRSTDNFLAIVTGAAYCLMLLGALTIRLDAIYDSLSDENLLSPQLRRTFSLPSVPVLVVLLCSTLAAIAFSVVILLREVLRDLRQPKLRYAGSRLLVEVPLPTGKTHHLFISHVWGTAQDQARVLRSRLQSVVPGVRVWLDVEDLTDISALEEAVDASDTLLVLVTAGYFQSRNCMRELVRCVAQSKPLIAVVERDAAHGGLTEAEARQQCVAAGAKFASWGFDANGPSADVLADVLLSSSGRGGGDGGIVAHGGRARMGPSDGATGPIVYERIGVFQQPMLRLIVQRLVGAREIFLPGEVQIVRRPGSLSPPSKGRQFHVWCSRHNPGVQQVLHELKYAGGYEGRLLVTEAPAQQESADHILLYLNAATWRPDDDGGDRKRALTDEITSALQAGRKLLLLHETDEGGNKGGVAQFAHFFGADQTPQELLALSIYAEIAISMKAPPYRTVSLGLLDRAIRARHGSGALGQPVIPGDLQAQQEPSSSYSARLTSGMGRSSRRLLVRAPSSGRNLVSRPSARFLSRPPPKVPPQREPSLSQAFSSPALFTNRGGSPPPRPGSPTSPPFFPSTASMDWLQVSAPPAHAPASAGAGRSQRRVVTFEGRASCDRSSCDQRSSCDKRSSCGISTAPDI